MWCWYMIENKKHSGNLTLLGGKKCLDFINTLDWRGKDRPVEYLNSFEDFIRWAAYVKIINPKEEKYFSKQAVMNIKKAEEALKITIELRELLHKMFLYIQHENRIQKQNLSRLNGFLQKAYISTVIKPSLSGFELEAGADKTTLTGLLNPIVWDAVNLLTSEDRLRVKSCADTTCGWMFFDISKNKSRQWCDMKSCGNRAKARKFYQQKKSGTMGGKS